MRKYAEFSSDEAPVDCLKLLDVSIALRIFIILFILHADWTFSGTSIENPETGGNYYLNGFLLVWNIVVVLFPVRI